MLLNLSNQQPSISPKTLPNPSPPIFSLSAFPIPIPLHKTLPFLNYRIPRNLFLVRASASDTRTLPQSAIKRIADKLRSLGYVDDNVKSSPRHDSSNSISTSPGEIFVPLPDQLPKHRVGHTMDPSWSTPENPVPKPGSCTAIRRYNELRREAWKEKKEDRERRKAEGREGEKLPTSAELKLSPEELRRLSGLGIGLRKKLKIGKAGITEGIVNGIHERWRRTELVKIVCEDMSRLNMKRTHDLLERKTGGLVIWRSGSKIILYRGADYKYPYFNEGNPESHDTSDGASLDLRMDSGIHGDNKTHSSGMDGAASVRHDPSNNSAQPPLIQGVGYPNRVRFQLPGEAQLVEEADHLLDGLGPRFTDWYGYDPQPVDADLLPAKVRGYRRPFRLLPYGVKPVLTNDEMTTLRRLGRPMPCHFALGRNRKHQGLAAAILKLWEKCEIAKIAVKRGVQNTNSELMADELKHLTGGTVLSRDREFIVLYRGKDFLPAAVSSAIEQRRKHGIHGEERRIVPSSSDGQESNHGRVESSSETGLGEMSVQKPRVGSRQRKLRSPEAAITRTTAKLSLALVKKERAEKLLEELEMEAIQKQPEVDKEGITEEERYMLRRVGLKMKPFLLLGRRGVFAGTVENMHLHWKYRELVKILSGERSIAEVYAVARTLEAESGGILVAVERVRKGHAIIVYRGKNYERPSSLRPDTLLNKREALKRSIEAQRRESLMLHVLKLNRNVDGLKLKLEKEKETITFQPANDSKLIFIKEQSVEESQSAECKGPEPDLEISSPHPASNQKIVQASNSHRDDSSSSSPNEGMDISSESLKTTWQDELSEFSMESDVMDVELDAAELHSDASGDSVQISQQDTPSILSVKYVDVYGKEFHKTESKALFESLKGTDAVMEMDNRNGEVVPVDSTSMSLKCPDDNKASNSHRADSSSSSPNEGMDISSDSLKTTWQDELSEFSMESDVMNVELDATELHSDASRDSVQISQQYTPSILSVKYVDGYGKEFHKTESKALFESVKGTDAIMEMDNRNGEVVPVDSTSMSLKCPDDNKSQGQTSYSSTRSVNTKNQVSSADSRIQMDKENQSIWKSFRATRLSNKERLLLRKQALKMKKRPVIAIGRSNIVKGVAKTIKAHFEKHPLAIVNVKGRAKGTSVQEVVSRLEEATGAVLVSQEPSKVILYRGWSANEEPPYKAYRTNTRDAGNTSAGKEGMAKPIISPELIAAIRLECGLACKLEVENEM